MRRRRKGRPVHGWLVLDKPVGMTSTQALSRVRQVFEAEKAGHAGTLDPLATGVLPVAFGEATKTIPLIQDGTKVYNFRIRWGEQRSTDDAEGDVIARSPHRPDATAIRSALARFVGEIEQVPPQYSAIKLDGERAYDLARDGEVVNLAPRLVWIGRFDLAACIDEDNADFRVECGKGTYMRALARDVALALETRGHVAQLRRLQVGPMSEAQAITLDQLKEITDKESLDRLLLPIETVLDDIPALVLTDGEAQRLRLGQSVALLQRQDRERLDPLVRAGVVDDATTLAMWHGRPVALIRLEGAEVRPVRVLNL